MKKNRNAYSINAVDRTLAILTALAGGGPNGMPLTEVAREVGLSESTTLRYLSSLGSHDCVIRNEDSGRYSLGLRLFQLGQSAVGAQDVRRIALPYMESLLERYRETVNLGAWRGSRLVIVDALESTQSIRRGACVGEIDQWGVSALGKAILATLDPERALALASIAHSERYTPRTITKDEDLIADLARVRERGYAIDDEEFEDGLRCVGAAIHDHSGRPIYALSISGAAARMSIEATHQMGRDVLAAARAISTELGSALLEQQED